MAHRRPYLRILQRGYSLQMEVRGDRGTWEHLSVLACRRGVWPRGPYRKEGKPWTNANNSAIALTKIARQAQERRELVFRFPFSPWAVRWLKRRKLYPEREGERETHRGSHPCEGWVNIKK